MRLRGCVCVCVCPSLEPLFVSGFESSEVELMLNSRADMEKEGRFLLLH